MGASHFLILNSVSRKSGLSLANSEFTLVKSRKCSIIPELKTCSYPYLLIPNNALRYFVQLIFHRRSRDERDALVDIIRRHLQDPKELETMAQTTAEFLIEQGIEQGIEQSKVAGKQDAVLKLLQLQFQNVPETLSREIRNIDNLTFLDTLLEQTVTAQSLEEIDTQFSLESPRND